MTREKKAVFVILIIIALIGTYINYRPSIDKVDIISVEITDVVPSPQIAKKFDNKNDMNEFSQKFYESFEKFKPMVLNLSKDFDSTIYIEGNDGSYIPMMIQDDCIKIQDKWYKTDNTFIEYINKFFDEKQGTEININESLGLKYYEGQ